MSANRFADESSVESNFPPPNVFFFRVSKNYGSHSGSRSYGKAGKFVGFQKFPVPSGNIHRSARGNYLRYSSSDALTNFYVATLFLFVIFHSTGANIMGDQCDWSGNGLSLPSNQNRGVTPIYLRCSQGHIKWSYPRGALRVVLRLPNSEKDFRGCIKVSPTFAGAQIFLVGPRSLTRLFSLNDGGEKQLARCFQSRKGQAAIYVEAVDNREMFSKEVAGFGYDLQPIPRGSSFFDLVNEECRPCSRQEMAHAFCTSDLVTRGLIFGIDDKQHLEIAEINIKITQVLRRLNDDSFGFGSDTHAADERRLINAKHNAMANEVGGLKINQSDIIKMNMPRHCDPEQGPGEFVFMGRKRLGDLTLLCATSLSDWADIVRSMNADGSSHCVLKV